MNVELTEVEQEMLDDCANQLKLTPEKTVSRALARLHCALFQSDAGLDDIDYSKSLDLSGESPEVVLCIFEIARANPDGEG